MHPSDLAHELHATREDLLTLQKLCQQLPAVLEHGDDEHRAWLREAVDAHFSGKPRPDVRGGSKKDAEIAALKAELAVKDASLDKLSTRLAQIRVYSDDDLLAP